MTDIHKYVIIFAILTALHFVFAIFQGSFFRTQDTMFGSETFGETVIVCNIKHLIRKKWNIGTFGNAVSRYSSAIYLELE